MYTVTAYNNNGSIFAERTVDTIYDAAVLWALWGEVGVEVICGFSNSPVPEATLIGWCENDKLAFAAHNQVEAVEVESLDDLPVLATITARWPI